MPSSAFVTQLFSSLMRVYRSFPPVAPYTSWNSKGGPIEEIHPGDVIWFPQGEKHWHGATPTTAMTHSVIQENPPCLLRPSSSCKLP
jgi:hypothetical protein